MTVDPLAFLRATLDAAQARAEAAGGDEWAPQDHPSDSVAIYDSKREPVVYDEGWPSPEQVAHIVANSPAAVLRLVAGHRKLIEAHTTPHTVVDDFCVEEGGPCTHRGEDECAICGQRPCDTIRLIAEGWGWTEEAT